MSAAGPNTPSAHIAARPFAVFQIGEVMRCPQTADQRGLGAGPVQANCPAYAERLQQVESGTCWQASIARLWRVQLDDLFTPVWIFGLLSLLSWGMPLAVSGYDVRDYFCSRETESKFNAAYRELRRPRQVAAILATAFVSLILWVRAPDWLGIATVITALLVQSGLSLQHLLVARRAAARS